MVEVKERTIVRNRGGDNYDKQLQGTSRKEAVLELSVAGKQLRRHERKVLSRILDLDQ